MADKCPCGLPARHYTDPQIEREVDKLVAALGTMIRVTVGDRAFWIDRHYIALHGIVGSEVANLGFEEITADG